jgi:hypothetical protein
LTSTEKYSVIWVLCIIFSKTSIATSGLFSTRSGSWEQCKDRKINHWSPLYFSFLKDPSSGSEHLAERILSQTTCQPFFD